MKINTKISGDRLTQLVAPLCTAMAIATAPMLRRYAGDDRVSSDEHVMALLDAHLRGVLAVIEAVPDAAQRDLLDYARERLSQG